MNEKKILKKIDDLTKQQTALYRKSDELWREKPIGYKIRLAVVKKQILNLAGEIAAWKARLDTE